MKIAQSPLSSAVAEPAVSSNDVRRAQQRQQAAAAAGRSDADADTGTGTDYAMAPVRRVASNAGAIQQSDISGAQQAVDFLEQSAAQLRGLKTELSAKLVSQQRSAGQLEARLRQFGDTWRNRQQASGGTLDAALNYGPAPAPQRFTVRGMTLANLRHGERETLAISVGGSAQGVRSVKLTPGMNDQQIVGSFDQALAPAKVRVSAGDDGALVFSTSEQNWPGVRDQLAMQGNGIRFPAGQLTRVKADPLTPAIQPEQWSGASVEALRATLHQVVQALAHIEQALSEVNLALNKANVQVDSMQPDVTLAGIGQAAENFVSTANEPSYQSLLTLSSALVGMSRERVISLLGLR
jgi:hypothetical protein